MRLFIYGGGVSLWFYLWLHLFGTGHQFLSKAFSSRLCIYGPFVPPSRISSSCMLFLFVARFHHLYKHEYLISCWRWIDLWNSRFTLASSPRLQEVLARRCILGVLPARPCHHQHSILGGTQTLQKSSSLIHLTSSGLHFMVSPVNVSCSCFSVPYWYSWQVVGLLTLYFNSLLVVCVMVLSFVKVFIALNGRLIVSDGLEGMQMDVIWSGICLEELMKIKWKSVKIFSPQPEIFNPGPSTYEAGMPVGT